MGLFDRFRGQLTEDKFAKLVMDGLRRAGDDRLATYNKAEFRLLHTKDGKEAGITNLRNLYTEYCNAPKGDRDAMLVRTCKGLVHQMELPDDFEDVKPDLLPTVRTRSMLEVLRLDSEIAGGKPLDVPWLPLTEHLVVCLVYDLPSTMRFVTQENLNDWGVTLYEAAEVAQRNLEERPFTMLSIGDKLFSMETGDAYDGTRVLLKDRIRLLELTGKPVVMPITRDSLLITGSEDSAGLDLMLTFAQKSQDAARPLSPLPMLLAGDEWETWSPPLDLPHFDRFKELELRHLYGEYDEQKKLLKKRNEQLGEDLFVATFSVADRHGKLLSYCVWSKTVPTWLPKTDFVGLFHTETNSHQFVQWGRLLDVAGELVQALDNYPPRWFVDEFPTDEQIARMQPENWSA